jgi:hypothetical protein
MGAIGPGNMRFWDKSLPPEMAIFSGTVPDDSDAGLVDPNYMYQAVGE